MSTDFREYQAAYTLSIVLSGDFNPAIVQPSWLSNKKLIREQEAQNAKIGIVHNEISKFDIDWALFEVTRDRFEIKTTQEPYFEPIKDLIVEIFKILKETPIRGVGINHLQYYDLRDQERHYKFGNKLAPLDNWNNYLHNPRLQTLEIVEKERNDRLKGQYTVRIQPPDIKLPTNFGVLININDHLNYEGGDFVKLFSENWKPSFTRANDICEAIWDKINK